MRVHLKGDGHYVRGVRSGSAKNLCVYNTRERDGSGRVVSPRRKPGKVRSKTSVCACTEKKTVLTSHLKHLKHILFRIVNGTTCVCVCVCSFVGVKVECKNAEAYKKNI